MARVGGPSTSFALRVYLRGRQKVVDALPSTWKEAVAAYVEHRSAQVKAPLMDLRGTTEFQARDISYQCAALQEIAKRLGAAEPTGAPTASTSAPSATRSRTRCAAPPTSVVT